MIANMSPINGIKAEKVGPAWASKPTPTVKEGEAVDTDNILPKKRKFDDVEHDPDSPPPELKEVYKKQCIDPFMFLYGHKNIIILGEEDFSISYEISKHFRKEQLEKGECRVVGTAYKPNDYGSSYDVKFKNHGGILRYDCDAQSPDTFQGEKFDGVVFTFPRLYQSLSPGFSVPASEAAEMKKNTEAKPTSDQEKTEATTTEQPTPAPSTAQPAPTSTSTEPPKPTPPKTAQSQDYEGPSRYFTMNRAFFVKWLSNALDHLVDGGKIYIVLIPNQFDQWDLNNVCCEIGLQWMCLGEFLYYNCLYYKPKNERGQEWEPYMPLIYSFFRPVWHPPQPQEAVEAAAAKEGVTQQPVSVEVGNAAKK